MRIELTGSYSNTPRVYDMEDAIEILNDCEADERIPRKEMISAWERGETVHSDWFAARPIAEEAEQAAAHSEDCEDEAECRLTECDVCKQKRQACRIARGNVTGIETYACDACRGEKR